MTKDGGREGREGGRGEERGGASVSYVFFVYSYVWETEEKEGRERGREGGGGEEETDHVESRL